MLALNPCVLGHSYHAAAVQGFGPELGHPRGILTPGHVVRGRHARGLLRGPGLH